MSKRKSGSTATRESNAERISKLAMAQIEADRHSVRAKTERLRALRLAKETAELTKRDLSGE
jgi:hypothetical protein